MRMNALKSLGHNISGIDTSGYENRFINILDRINFRLSYKFDLISLNNRILKEFSHNNFDIVWIDKGKRVFPGTLKKIKIINPLVKIVHINPDDPFGKFNRGWKTFIKAIPYYDIHFVAREVNVPEYMSVGAKKVYVYDRSFDPEIHKPIELTDEEKLKYGCKVGFIGSWAKDREKSIAYLIENGIEVAVWGNGWQKGKYWNLIKKYWRGPGLNGIEYAKAINGMEIALHFLRKENRDEQDSRTFEIPACGTFMLAERTKKHEEFFEDGKEAVFFDDDEDLLKKVKYSIHNPEKRTSIASAGRQRSLLSGYSHKERLKIMLDKVID
jgi:hypothetical protein